MVTHPPPLPRLPRPYDHDCAHDHTDAGPPRCARRLSDMPPPSSILPSRKRKLAPSAAPASAVLPSSPSISESSADPQDTEYEPLPSRVVVKRVKNQSQSQSQGHGPGHVGGSGVSATGTSGNVAKGARGMSREALRKANHSLIERRRREKINAALGELRDMVPGLGEAGGGKGGEFKLEVRLGSFREPYDSCDTWGGYRADGDDRYSSGLWNI